MVLYNIDIQIKGSKHHFTLILEGDDRFSDNGDWTIWSPGDLYLGQWDGYWRLTNNRLVAIYLDTKKMPSALKFWTWGDEYPKELAVLYTEKMGAILDQRQQGWGYTSILRGSWEFTWKVVHRFV